MTQTVLLIEDSVSMQQMLNQYLSESGFHFICANTAKSGLEQLANHYVDIILLDILLPDNNGIELCQTIRQQSNIPIIILTGTRATAVKCLSVGADDYMSKPFDPDELILRMHNLLHRYQTSYQGQPLETTPIQITTKHYDFLGWYYEPEAQRLQNPDKKVVELTAAEHHLLTYLLAHAGQIVSRENIAQAVYMSDYGATVSRSIDTLVYRLKSKLKYADSEDTMIQSVRNKGYQWIAPMNPTTE